MPEVSVILPTCDRPRLWPRALASVLQQTHTDLEVLLVDSNRREAPVRTHSEFEQAMADPRVRLIEHAHAPSASAARNLGLRAATGKWITYLDDDDTYHPEKVAQQLSRAKATGAPLILCGYTVFLPRRRRTRQVSADAYRGDALLTDATWCTSLLFHRAAPAIEFNEALVAGEDEAFAHAFLAAHRADHVPNCAQSLVNAYPQLGAPRVHSNHEGSWQACRVTLAKTRGQYSHEARRAYLAFGRLVRAQGGHGTLPYFVACAWGALRARGPRCWRLIANASVRRSGRFSEWVVS